MAYLEAGHAAPGTVLEVAVLERRLPAVVVADSPYDPENARLRL
jgi:dimethylglycine dehydrogenase